MFQQQEQGHPVTVQGYDPGNDEEKGPQKNIDGCQQIQYEHPSGYGKSVQKVIVGGAFPLVQRVENKDHKAGVKQDLKDPNGDVDEDGTGGRIVVFDYVLEERQIHGL